MKRCALVVASFASCGLFGPHGLAEERAPSVWYRSSDGCPDGASFLRRLRGAAAGASLAGAGDRIDFVVTLGTAGGESSGRLERQTQEGTVAVREIAAPSCEEVAEVLALTLALALEPGTPAAREPSRRAAPHAAPAAADRSIDPAETPRAEADAGAGAARKASAAAPPRSVYSVGAQAGVLTSVVPALAPLGTVFVELEPNLPLVTRATLRLSLLGAWSERASEPALHMRLLAGRFEVCPIELGSGALRARPCLGIDGGGVWAGLTEVNGDTGPWAALSGHVRGAWALGPSVALEGQLGGVAPLIRYALRTRDAGAEVYRSAALGLSASAGVAFRLP